MFSFFRSRKFSEEFLILWPRMSSHSSPFSYSNKPLIGSLDVGTSSVRFVVFDDAAKPLCSAQVPLPSLHPHPGWVEQSPETILHCSLKSIEECNQNWMKEGHQPLKEVIRAVGITNQRETTVLWHPHTSAPLHNAIGRIKPHLPSFLLLIEICFLKPSETKCGTMEERRVS